MAVLTLDVATFFLILAKAKSLTRRGLYAVYDYISAGFRYMLQCLVRLT